MTASGGDVPVSGSLEGPVPTRTCIGCRQRAAAKVLLRIVVSSGTIVVPDPQRRAAGRGAWLHPVAGCVELAERRRAFGRAFKIGGHLDSAPVREYVTTMRTFDSTGTSDTGTSDTGTTHDQKNPTSGDPQE